jgi:thiol-disulfide isomerase/thioredoxin
MAKNLSTVFTALVLAIFANFFFFKGLTLPIEKRLEAKAKGLPDEKSISEFIGKEQINFHGIDESGKEVDIKSITEGKPAVIVFFAIGDKPGTFDFLPHMNELYDKYKDKVEFVGVLLSRSNAKEVQELKKMLPLKMPVLLGYSDAIKGYEISKLDVPFIVFVDEKGKVERIIVRPESDMIEEAPAVNREDYKNMTLQQRINKSIKNIDNYIQEMLK